MKGERGRKEKRKKKKREWRIIGSRKVKKKNRRWKMKGEKARVKGGRWGWRRRRKGVIREREEDGMREGEDEEEGDG